MLNQDLYVEEIVYDSGIPTAMLFPRIPGASKGSAPPRWECPTVNVGASLPAIGVSFARFGQNLLAITISALEVLDNCITRVSSGKYQRPSWGEEVGS